RTFDKRLLLFDAPVDSLLTEDKKRLIIDVYARARIIDPLLFFRTLGSESGATARVVDIVSNKLRTEIARDEQTEIIRTNRELIMNNVRDVAAPQLEQFGMEIVDVRIKRADFPPEIAESIYARMRAERERIANRERAEGAQRDLEIRANADRQATIIRAEAERDANITRGAGEAEAVGIFAEALQQDPEFYRFQRSLEAYESFLTANTTIVLPSNSALFEFLSSPDGNGSAPATEPPAAFAQLSGLMRVESAAREFLAVEKEVASEELNLMGIEVVQWQDASLGCPRPGETYSQVTVPGFSLTFEHNGSLSRVHTNADATQIISCQA
ncbi:MAG: protease modulator HflC, partial [Chloroflexi bacterium]|nr:protease modulator HflC [Chloroflexota bacterium]